MQYLFSVKPLGRSCQGLAISSALPAGAILCHLMLFFVPSLKLVVEDIMSLILLVKVKKYMLSQPFLPLSVQQLLLIYPDTPMMQSHSPYVVH